MIGTIFLLAQIGELFEGKFNWRGLFMLFLFGLMILIIGGLTIFLGAKAFSKKSDKYDEH